MPFGITITHPPETLSSNKKARAFESLQDHQYLAPFTPRHSKNQQFRELNSPPKLPEMSRLSDDEDMTSSTPSTPSTPINAAPHAIPPHLGDLKTPPQSQDNTPYASRTAVGEATSAGYAAPAGAAAPTLQTNTSNISAFQDFDDTGDLTSPTSRRAQAGANNGVSIMPSTEKGVPAWLTKRGLEEIANAEEKLVDRQFTTSNYGSLFSDRDMMLQK